MQESERLAVVKTALPPCCLRIHPSDNSIIILGTYKLEEDGRRHGSIDVYLYEENELALINLTLTEAAVLDIKFSPDASVLVSVHSTGNLIVWNINLELKELSQLHNWELFPLDNLITSVFFSPTKASSVLVTLTSGELAIVDISTGTTDVLSTSHDLECWTGSFGEVGALENVVYTGGDDAKLIAHDLRSNEKIWSTSYNHHEAGVVSILLPGPKWNQSNPNNLWTGSYDDQLRILDLRLIDKENPLLMEGYIPRVVHSENLGGGVWRLVPSPTDERVLVCCMYDGARIVNKTETFEVGRYFKKDHESMCYGGDWASGGDFVGTCSFYDNVVQIWSPN